MNHLFKFLTKTILVVSLIRPELSMAALIDNGNGLIYDETNNLTWLSDANLFLTMAKIDPELVPKIIAANNGVVREYPNSYDGYTGTYNLIASEFNTTTGQLNWMSAKAWVGYLNSISYKGSTDWRLPSATPASFGSGIVTSELGELFYGELGGIANNDITYIHNL